MSRQRRKDQRYARGRTTPEAQPEAASEPAAEAPAVPQPRQRKAAKKKTTRKRRPSRWDSRSDKATLVRAAKSRGLSTDGTVPELRAALKRWDKANA